MAPAIRQALALSSRSALGSRLMDLVYRRLAGFLPFGEEHYGEGKEKDGKEPNRESSGRTDEESDPSAFEPADGSAEDQAESRPEGCAGKSLVHGSCRFRIMVTVGSWSWSTGGLVISFAILNF